VMVQPDSNNLQKKSTGAHYIWDMKVMDKQSRCRGKKLWFEIEYQHFEHTFEHWLN